MKIINLNESLSKEMIDDIYDYLSVYIADTYYTMSASGVSELFEYGEILDDVKALYGKEAWELGEYVNFTELQKRFNKNFINNSLRDIQADLGIDITGYENEVEELIKEKILSQINVEEIMIDLVLNNEW